LNPQEIAGARYLARTNEAPDAQRIDAAIMSAQEEINRSVTGLPETFAKIDAQNAQSRKHLEKVHSSLYGGLQYVSDSDPDGLISEIRDARLGSRNI
jgi:hypothetical protein